MNTNKNNFTLPDINNRSPNFKSPSKQPNSNFNKFYQEYTDTKSLIENRLENLKKHRFLLKNMNIREGTRKPKNDIFSLYNYKNLGKNKNIMNNPSLYSNNCLEPIYYPLEMPVNGEQVKLPNVELGQVVCDNRGGGGNSNGLGIGDLMALIKIMGDNNFEFDIDVDMLDKLKNIKKKK